MSLLDNLYNCWQFKDSLDGVAGQPFVIPAPIYEPGHFTGNGLRCNGTADSTGTTPGTSVMPIAGDWVGALWFKPITFSTSRSSSVLTSNVNTGIAGFRLRISAQNTNFNIVDATGQNVSVNAAAVSLDEWHLALFGHNATTLKGFLRVDNVQAEFLNPFIISTAQPSNIAIGNFPQMNQPPLNAACCLLAFWTGRILTEAEMNDLWNGGAGLDYPFS